MTNKEYRAKLATMDVYSSRDYLKGTDIKELRADAKRRVENGKETYLSGFRATTRTESRGLVLRSYNTDVAYFDHDGKFHKTWDDYSATTLKHVNLFREKRGLAPMNKREWIEMKMY